MYGHLKRRHPGAQALYLQHSAELRWTLLVEHAFVEKLALPTGSQLFMKSPRGDVLPCGGLGGKQMRAAIQLAPHIVHGLHGSRCPATGRWLRTPRDKDPIEEVFVAIYEAYAAHKRYNCPHGHTDESLPDLAVALLRCRTLFLNDRTFLEDNNHGWQIPKFWMAFLSAEKPHEFALSWIKLFGHPEYFSTEPGEASLSVTSSAARGTNKNKDTMTTQMIQSLAAKNVTTLNMQLLGLSAAPPTLGTAKTALQLAKDTGKDTFPGKGVAVKLSMLDGTVPMTPEIKKLMEHRSGLHKLRAQLAEHLHEEDAADLPPDAVLEVVNYGILIGKPLHLKNTERIAYQPVYASPKWRGHKRFSWVAIDAGDDEWFGQVQLLFRCGVKKFAFLKYVTPVNDHRLVRGALLTKSGCGLYEWEQDSYGVVEFGDRIIRREVFLPDLSEVYVNDVAPAARKKTDPSSKGVAAKANAKKHTAKKSKSRHGGAAATSDACVADDEAEVDEDWPVCAKRAAPASQKAKKSVSRKRQISDDDDDTATSDCPDDAADEEDAEAAHEEEAEAGCAKEPRQSFRRWIRTQLVWGFDGGRYNHERHSDEDEESE